MLSILRLLSIAAGVSALIVTVDLMNRATEVFQSAAQLALH